MLQSADLQLLNSNGELLSFKKYWQCKKDCLVDMVNRKIVLNGVPMTSNDLRSQHYTTHFLYKLYTSKTKLLTLADLPKGSYTESKYDFYHKIVVPLERCAKKYVTKEFKVVCIGTLHDFVIKLMYSDLDVYFLVNKEDKST